MKAYFSALKKPGRMGVHAVSMKMLLFTNVPRLRASPRHGGAGKLIVLFELIIRCRGHITRGAAFITNPEERLNLQNYQ
jgi:hypothetical protein